MPKSIAGRDVSRKSISSRSGAIFRRMLVFTYAVPLVLAASSAPAATEEELVLNHVTIVDTHDGKLTRDMAVVLADGKIVHIVPSRSLKARGARFIDARGKYLVPGYNDMHGHPLNDEGVERLDNLTLMLANGITGFRQMSGSTQLLSERRNGTLLPNSPVPAVLAMPGDVLIRPVAPTPEAGVAAVDRQKAEGADFIKVVDASVPTFFAIGAEAKRVGLPFLGHLPNGVDALKASEAGYRSIEHLGPFATILISCSTDEAAIRAAMASRKPTPPPALTPAQALQALETGATEPLLLQAADPNLFPLLDHVVDTYSEAKCRNVAKTFIANGTWQSPTLIRVKTIEFGDDPQFVNDPNLRYVSSKRRAVWTMVVHRFSATFKPEQKAVLGRFWTVQLRMLKLFDQMDVPMIAGTDVGGQWDIPGFSLHQDFDLLAADGFAPLKILQMTTLYPAKFLGREAEMGSVSEGRAADLVLLDANPVIDAQNLHKIAAVVRAGTYFSKQDLETMKRTVSERVGEKMPS